MEHRWHHRKPLNHSVIIYRQGCAIAICAVKNISLGGIALQSGPLGFPRNTPVEIELQLDHALHMRRHRLPACVVYHRNGTTGLAFTVLSDSTRAALRRMVATSTDRAIPETAAPVLLLGP